MKLAKNLINQGFLQGILVGDVSYPNKKTAIFTVKVKDARIRVKSDEEADISEITTEVEDGNNASEKKKEDTEKKEKEIYLIQCTAFNEVAAALTDAKRGQLIFLRYHLTTSKKMNSEGVTSYYKNRIVEQVTLGEFLDGQQVIIPYLNSGVCQGEFVDVARMPDEDKIAHIRIRVTEIGLNQKAFTYYLQFTAYGPIIDSIERFYMPGDSICVNYKIETSTKRKQLLLDYVVTALV